MNRNFSNLSPVDVHGMPGPQESRQHQDHNASPGDESPGLAPCVDDAKYAEGDQYKGVDAEASVEAREQAAVDGPESITDILI